MTRAFAALGLSALLGSACDGLDITEVFEEVTGVDALRPDAGVPAAVADDATGDEPGATAGDSTGSDAGTGVDGLRGACGLVRVAMYEFPSRFVAGASSVAYGEAVLDHVLVAELGGFIEGLTARVQAGERFAAGELVAQLAARLGAGSMGTLADEPLALRLAGAPALAEATHGDLSRDTDVLSRLGGDAPGELRGFSDTTLGRGLRASFSARSLLDASFEQLEVNAQNRALGFLQTDPTRTALPLHVTRDGRDWKAFVQSFLLGAVSFAGGVGVELDDDVAGKGLVASEARAGDERHSALEHAWDLGFGYFGAARDFDRYVTVAESEAARRNGWLDTDADCRVRLLGEASLGAAALSLPTAAIGFAAEAFTAFVAGRLLVEAPSPLSDSDRARLLATRDRAVAGWERALAATALHELNQLVTQIERALVSAPEYSFAEQARAWSVLKGLSLGFQFNRRSPLSAARFEAFHFSIGDAPSVPDTLPPRNGAGLGAYRDRLTSARVLLVAAYGFDATRAAAW